jgi:hypothetical protein
MGWLDDLRMDPDGTHARLVRRLYSQRIAAAFAMPFISEASDGRRQAIVPVEAECPLVLLPPIVADADEIVIAFADGRRLCIDSSKVQRWRHMVAAWVAAEQSDEANLS